MALLKEIGKWVGLYVASHFALLLLHASSQAVARRIREYLEHRSR